MKFVLLAGWRRSLGKGSRERKKTPQRPLLLECTSPTRQDRCGLFYARHASPLLRVCASIFTSALAFRCMCVCVCPRARLATQTSMDLRKREREDGDEKVENSVFCE